jgi:hypothetical protein
MYQDKASTPVRIVPFATRERRSASPRTGAGPDGRAGSCVGGPPPPIMSGFEKAVEGFFEHAERHVSDVFEVLAQGDVAPRHIKRQKR